MNKEIEQKARKLKPVFDRLMALTEPIPESGCWIWLWASHRGYGYIEIAGKSKKAHRVSYELARGQIPDGLVLDHICRVRCCINPFHLEAVTHAENVRRGEMASRTHCLHGHAFTSDNIGPAEYGRRCKACHREQSRRLKAKKTTLLRKDLK